MLAALQGLIGDKLHEQGSVLATTMSVRAEGRPVALDTDSLRAAYPPPQATSSYFSTA